jgi:hypothetical protein
MAAVSTKTSSPVVGLVLFVIAVAVIVAVGHLRYHEMDELRAGVKRTVGDRRVRVANNIRMRRASLALSKASSLSELFEAIVLMLEFEEFAYANVQLGQPGHAEVIERAFKANEQRRPQQKIHFINGRVFWSWKENGFNPEEVMGSTDFWCFRLPLSTPGGEWGWLNLYRAIDGPPLLLDMNFLAGIFHTELSEAAARIIKSFDKPASSEAVPLTMTAGKVAG